MHLDLSRLVGLSLLLRHTKFLQIVNLSTAADKLLIWLTFSRSPPDQRLKKVPSHRGFTAIETLFCSEPPDWANSKKSNWNNELRDFVATLVAVLPQKSQELLLRPSVHAGFERWGFEMITVTKKLKDWAPRIWQFIRVRNAEEALQIANDTPYGLFAGVCTTSLKQASKFKRELLAGMVMINAPTAGVDPHVPFGGRKYSSFGTRK